MAQQDSDYDQSNITWLVTDNPPASIYNDPQNRIGFVTKRNRIDYIIEYAMLANYQASLSKSKNKLYSFVLEENPGLLVTYAACNKTKIGKKFIEELSQLLNSNRNTPEYLEIMENYWGWYDENGATLLRNSYPSFIDSQSSK